MKTNNCILVQLILISCSIVFVSSLNAADKALILANTVVDGTSSLEAQAAQSLGFNVDVKDATWWSDPARTIADFAAYRVVIIGDPDCNLVYQNDYQTALAAAQSSTGVWGPAINGNVIIIGTDDVFHAFAGQQGAFALINDGIAFAAAQPGKTGFYISLSCYYELSLPNTPVPVLQPFGSFTVESAKCYNNVHIVATHPALAGLTDFALSGWSCSIHEVFDTWPSDFQVLAIGRDFNSSYIAPDGSVGAPYIFARGIGLVPTPGCGAVSVGNAQISNSTFAFNIVGPPDSYWNEYASSDLISWTLLSGVTLDSSGQGYFTDNNISGVAHRYYKLSNGTCCSQGIGFERETVGSGFTPIANQLDAPLATLNGLFNPEPDGTTLPNGIQIEKYNNSTSAYDVYTWSGGAWSPNGNATLAPGEGAMIVNSSGNSLVLTFVGLVREGQTSTSLTANQVKFVDSVLPLAGGIQTVLGYVPSKRDTLQIWNQAGQNFSLYTFMQPNPPQPGNWSPSEPVIGVGQSFFIKPAVANVWNQTYSACGSVVCSAPHLSINQISTTAFTFNIVGAPNSYWDIFESSDLISWTLLSGVTLDSSGQGYFTDNNISGVAHRYYKLSNGTCCSQGIGFERETVGSGFTPIANQLDAPLATLNGLFNPEPDGTTLPNGIQIEKYNNSTSAYDVYTWSGGAWSPNGNATLAPGEGAMIVNSSGNSLVLTFVGLVREGQTSTSLTANQVKFVDSVLPLAGGIQTVLGYVPSKRDTLQIWNQAGQNFSLYTFMQPNPPQPGNWSPSEPVIGVGQSFFIKPAVANVWNQTYSACGSVVCSAPHLSINQISTTAFTFNIVGAPNSYWDIFESSDLQNWTWVSGLMLDGSGQGYFTDNNISGVAHRYYKLSNGTCCSQGIGFERETVGSGFTPIANQLDAPLATLNGLFNPEPDGTTLPNGIQIEKYNNSTSAYDVYTWSGGAWSPNGNATLAPGEGAMIVNSSGNSLVLTFVGLVREGQTSTSLTANQVKFVDSVLPLAGGIQTVLGYVPSKRDTLQIWNQAGQNFSLYTFMQPNPPQPGNWSPSEPVIGVGQSFFIKPAVANVWNQTYSACSGGQTILNPIIVTQPQSQGVVPGGNATFNVVALGEGTLTYQWYDNGTFIGNGASITIQNAKTSDAGTYYVIISNANGTIVSANAILTVRADQVPVADSMLVSANKNVARNITLTGSDPDSDPLTFSVVNGPAHGTLIGMVPNLIYRSSAGYTGGDSFTYKVNDGFLDSALATVTITIFNTAPVAVPQSVTASKNAAIAITLGGADVNGDALTYSHSSATHGTLTGTGNNWIYTPNANYTGPDNFTFTVNDGTVNSSPATVSINVIDPTLGFTVATSDIFQIQEDSGQNQLDVLANDSDSNGNSLTIIAKTDGGHGSVILAPDGLSLYYTPANGFYGSDTFTYTISNGHGNTSQGSVAVFVDKTGNNNPNAVDYSTILAVGVHTATINLLANDSDPDNDTITIYSIDQPNMGTIQLNGNGQITYTRDPSKFGTDSFGYIITDGNGGYATANVTVNQVDSDGDGMPDEWELKYGLNPADASDALTDLDNDGFPNLAEYELHTNPQLADNPLTIPVANGTTISGEWKVQLPLNATLNESVSIELLLNGEPTTTADVEKDPDGTWWLDFETDTIPNGSYTTQLRYTYPQPLNNNIDPSKVYVSGSPITLNINNVLTFDALSGTFASKLFIKATANSQAATYSINIYNVNDPSTVIKSIPGNVVGGQINTSWDFINDNVNVPDDLLVNVTLYPDQTVNNTMPANGGLSTSHTFHKEINILNDSTFVVGYHYLDPDQPGNSAAIQNNMVSQVVNNLVDPGLDYPYFLLPSFNTWYGYAFELTGDKQNIATMLASIRTGDNFYYSGHGDEKSIGSINYLDVAEQLGNDKHRKYHKVRRPYRLVFLDACATYSTYWAKAFGIPYVANGASVLGNGDSYTVADFEAIGRAPRALIGYVGSGSCPVDNSAAIYWDLYFSAHTAFIDAWMAGVPLITCMREYAAVMATAGLNPDEAYNWQITGARDLSKIDPDYGN